MHVLNTSKGTKFLIAEEYVVTDTQTSIKHTKIVRACYNSAISFSVKKEQIQNGGKVPHLMVSSKIHVLFTQAATSCYEASRGEWRYLGEEGEARCSEHHTKLFYSTSNLKTHRLPHTSDTFFNMAAVAAPTGGTNPPTAT